MYCTKSSLDVTIAIANCFSDRIDQIVPWRDPLKRSPTCLSGEGCILQYILQADINIIVIVLLFYFSLVLQSQELQRSDDL
jgi:Mg2+/citrate symporter